MKKKQPHRNAFWKGIPDELRHMCLAQVRSTGRYYCTQPILQYLIDHMTDCESDYLDTSPYDIIRWIDTAIETCLFPLEFHENHWTTYREEISQVLNQSEKLLQKHAPSDYRSGHRTPYDYKQRINIIAFAQKLNVYFCAFYIYAEENRDKLKERLEMLLADTERNVQYLLTYEDPYKYASQDDRAEFHYPGTDVFEPLNWLDREYIPGRTAKQLLAQTYEQYALFLEKCEDTAKRSQASAYLREQAEERLKDLCELVVEEIVDDLEEADGDTTLLQEEKAVFESMIQKSEERLCSMRAEENDLSADHNNDHAVSDMVYHRTNGAFTKKLRALMKEYPSMPVVVSSSFSAEKGETDCMEAYIHDSKTGKFLEKVILICNKEYRDSFADVLQNEELPF